MTHRRGYAKLKYDYCLLAGRGMSVAQLIRSCVRKTGTQLPGHRLIRRADTNFEPGRDGQVSVTNQGQG